MKPHSIYHRHDCPWPTRSTGIPKNNVAISPLPTSVAAIEIKKDAPSQNCIVKNGLKLSKELLSSRGGTVSTPFPVKLHRLLDCMDVDGHSDIVSWAPHGRSFVVKKPEEFVRTALSKHFKTQTKFSSFRRQMNLYGFKRLSTGPDAGGYYHELFVRNKPLLAYRIVRITKNKKSKRTLLHQHHRVNDQDPELEPDVSSSMISPITTHVCAEDVPSCKRPTPSLSSSNSKKTKTSSHQEMTQQALDMRSRQSIQFSGVAPFPTFETNAFSTRSILSPSVPAPFLMRVPPNDESRSLIAAALQMEALLRMNFSLATNENTATYPAPAVEITIIIFSILQATFSIP